MYLVTASNAKGESVQSVLKTGKEADLLHRMLWNQQDADGLFVWGTVRTTDLEYEKNGGGTLSDTTIRPEVA